MKRNVLTSKHSTSIECYLVRYIFPYKLIIRKVTVTENKNVY